MKAVLTAMSAACLLLACGSQPKATPAASEVMPKAESLVQPAYPESARKAGIEGTAVVEVTVSTDGAVLGCSLATSSGNALLDAAAVGAAKSSKFTPGTKDGKPAVMKVRVTLRFRLADDSMKQHSAARSVQSWAARHQPVLPAREV
jgi:protein TonB